MTATRSKPFCGFAGQDPDSLNALFWGCPRPIDLGRLTLGTSGERAGRLTSAPTATINTTSAGMKLRVLM
jgi:hypothetical protein